MNRGRSSQQTAQQKSLIAAVRSKPSRRFRLKKTPDGALIRATGIASTQGQFNAQLVPVSNEGGTLTLAFRIQAAAGSTGVNAARSREVTVARFMSFDELSDVKTIVVQGATNARSTSR